MVFAVVYLGGICIFCKLFPCFGWQYLYNCRFDLKGPPVLFYHLYHFMSLLMKEMKILYFLSSASQARLEDQGLSLHLFTGVGGCILGVYGCYVAHRGNVINKYSSIYESWGCDLFSNIVTFYN